MKINFYPSWDKPEYEEAAKEYAKIWEEEGSRITEAIEKISGLKFREKVVNALVFGGISNSGPLRLNANLDKKRKKGDLTHELCHRLLYGNTIKFEKLEGENAEYLIQHKPIDLILYDIWTELYGEEFAKEQIPFEIDEWTGKGVSPYKIAWNWALSMTKEERQKEFRKYLK